ncbi:hypothetical protein D5S19_14035 [Amycolatopsis panacis]|uniref:Transmembrane protein n=1 Tax=Amycolatopsis panacis TaxID=2340917 RepID=A0A419I4S9_9PSEU|nr:hypothetical protein D5S19_14035 [Amycolatopsis panacis]
MARSSDRVQAALLLVSVLIGLAAIPFCAAAGSELYARQKQVSVHQLADRSPATATLLADGPPVTFGGRSGVLAGSAPTEATWRAPDGSRRVGMVTAESGTHRGDQVPTWIDRSGQVVAPPLTGPGVLADAVCAGLSLWVASCSVLALLCAAVVFGLNRRRWAEWQREWDDYQAKRMRS